MFTTQRWDVNPPEQNLIYSFPVTTGRTYQVNLYFTELFGEGQGTRQFDILIDDVLVQNNLDILSLANNSEKIAIVAQFEVEAIDDFLDVEFSNETTLPAVISALEIVDMTSTNQAPVATIPDSQSSIEQETVSLQIEVTDDSNELFYEAAGLPGGLAINASTGLISGTLDEGVEGEFDVTITVFDDGDPPAGTIFSFQWSVANDPIVVNPIADVSAELGNADIVISLLDVFEDPNESALTYSIAENTDPSIVSVSLSEGDGTITLNFDDSVPGSTDITVRATNANDGFAEDIFTVEVLGMATPSAIVQITPTDGLGGSTFNGNSFLIENTSTGNITINTVTINLANTLFPDMVYDPTGIAGDSGAKCLTVDQNDEESGFVAPEDPCVDPFSLPVDDGFQEMTLNFTDFNPGELVGLSVDVDPTSIKGNPNVGDAGSVGGVELIGAVVTIEFSNEETITNDVFYLAESGGGGEAIIKNTTEQIPLNPAAAPTISFLGQTDSEVSYTEVAQSIVVSGPVGASVILVQVDSRLNLEGTPNGGFDIDPFEANEAIGVVETYETVLDGAGSAIVTVNLKRSFFGGSFSGGINHFIAVVVDEFPGRTSNRLIGNLEEISTTNFDTGWNFIGLSVNVDNNNYLNLYAEIAPELPPYGWSADGYVQSETLDNGAAYWINAANAGDVPIFGTEIETLTIALDTGWNMIAGPSCTVDVTDVQDSGNIIVNGTFFEYDDGYINATSIQPNKGYWVNASGDGTITMSCIQETESAKHHAEVNQTESFGSLLLSDQKGNDQVLYFGGELEGDARDRSYLLPPYGPSGFDARFSDGTRLIENNKAVIALRSKAFPVEVAFTEAPSQYVGMYTIEAVAGNEVVGTYTMGEGERILITDENVTFLRLATLTSDVEVLPEQFTLDGNYPNPFNPSTTIVFNLPEAASMRVDVYDLIGRQVMTLDGFEMQAGAGRQIQLDASSLASGSYIYRVHATMEAGNLVQTGRMTLLK